MKKRVSLIFLGLMIILLTGCNSKTELKGKYIYNNDDNSIIGYYDCNSKTCKWHMYFNGRTSDTEYNYKIEKTSEYTDDKELIEKFKDFYTIIFSEVDNNHTTYKAVYDQKSDSIYDPELGITYIKGK